MTRIAVIIPTLDEARHLPAALDAVHAGGEPEAIVVADCGSRDETVDLARQRDVPVVTGEELTSRAAAMNAGARWITEHHSRSEVLWFLHADSIAPTDWHEGITSLLAADQIIGGAFDFVWDLDEAPRGMHGRLRFLAAFNRMRFRMTRSYFGDQGIFVRRAAFERVGGFPDRTLLEDVILCRRLRAIGRIDLVPSLMRTSPRRFVRHGPLRQALVDAVLIGAERIGLEPRRCHAWYNREKAPLAQNLNEKPM